MTHVSVLGPVPCSFVMPLLQYFPGHEKVYGSFAFPTI